MNICMKTTKEKFYLVLIGDRRKFSSFWYFVSNNAEQKGRNWCMSCNEDEKRMEVEKS